MDAFEYLQLADWRRRVASMYARWRDESVSNPEAATMEWRTARDELFRSHSQSPLPLHQRARFGGLSYYPYNPAYRMTVKLEPAHEPTDTPAGHEGFAVQLPTSGDEPFSFRLIGQVTLSGPLAGAVLPLFWMAGYAGGLFLPLRDATAGSDTYAAGRYLLDSVKGADFGGAPDDGELLLDFNLAYHPSCAYDPRWNCPLAPLESRLEVALRVGERLASSTAQP